MKFDKVLRRTEGVEKTEIRKEKREKEKKRKREYKLHHLFLNLFKQ